MKGGQSALFVIVAINILAILFYYSPITLYGYWTDTIFLLMVLLSTVFHLKRIQNKILGGILIISCSLNFIVILFTSLSVWHGLLPVHFIPKGHFQDIETYGYFIERGNFGLLNSCYGEVQYQKQIAWLPFLEIKIETDHCSQLDYNNIIEGA